MSGNYWMYAVIGELVVWLFVLAFNCGMGAIAVHMARKRGLSAVPAFFMGFFLSFVALFIVALIPIRQSGDTQRY